MCTNPRCENGRRRYVSAVGGSPLTMIPRTRVLFVIAVSVCARLAAGSQRDSGDTPLKIIQTTESNFPPALAAEGIHEGEVRVVIVIDADGKLADFLVTSFTHPAFAREVLSSLRAWEYEPAREHGKPVGMRTEATFYFEARGMVLSVSPHDLLSGQANRMFGSAPTLLLANAADLDQPLTAIEVVQPRHPGKSIKPAQPRGTATLDFYVDAEGRPRMPVVIRASHEWFGAAAAQALAQWRFSPPTREGRGVAVRVVQEFVFGEDS
jgi:TonB family protein